MLYLTGNMHCDMMHQHKALWCQSRQNDSFSMKLLWFPKLGFCQWKQARNPLVALEYNGTLVRSSCFELHRCKTHAQMGAHDNWTWHCQPNLCSAVRIPMLRCCGSFPLQPRVGGLSCRSILQGQPEVTVKWTEQYGSFKKCGRGRTSRLLCWTIIRSC